MMLALPPDCVRWICRNGEDNDCAVAAIALACGISYEAALGAAMGQAKNPIHVGMTLREIRATIKALGYKARTRKSYDLDEDTGILWVSVRGEDDHVVYLWEGRVIEPSLGRRSLWLDPKNYLTHEDARAGVLITVETE